MAARAVEGPTRRIDAIACCRRIPLPSKTTVVSFARVDGAQYSIGSMGFRVRRGGGGILWRSNM